MQYPSIFHRHLVEHFGEKQSAVLKLSIIGARKMYETRQRAAVTVSYTDRPSCRKETLQTIKAEISFCNARRPVKYRVRYDKMLRGDKYGQTFSKKTGEIERGSVTKNLP